MQCSRKQRKWERAAVWLSSVSQRRSQIHRGEQEQAEKEKLVQLQVIQSWFSPPAEFTLCLLFFFFSSALCWWWRRLFLQPRSSESEMWPRRHPLNSSAAPGAVSQSVRNIISSLKVSPPPPLMNVHRGSHHADVRMIQHDITQAQTNGIK